MNCLGRNLGEPECFEEAAEEAEEATRRYVAPVVGSTRSRGVGGVMPVEDASPLEGVDGISKREKAKDARHRNGNNRVQAFSYSGTRERERRDAVCEPCSFTQRPGPSNVLHEP